MFLRMGVNSRLFSRASCCSYLAGPVRTSLRRGAETSALRSTSCFAAIRVPVNPSCSSTCITWFLVVSTRPGKDPVLWVSQRTWWRTQKLDSWFCRQERSCSVTTASAASTSSIRWATARGLCCMRSWSSKRSLLLRWGWCVNDHCDDRLSGQLINAVFVRHRLESFASLMLGPPSSPQPIRWSLSGTPRRPPSKTSSFLTHFCPGKSTASLNIHNVMYFWEKLNFKWEIVKREWFVH